MSLTGNLISHRPATATRAPYKAPCACRCNRRLVQTHVLNKQRPSTSDETTTSYTDSSDDERPSTSGGSGVDAARTLFDDKHIAVWRPDLMLYAPIGVALAAFRSALWILGIALDQSWFRDQSIVDAYLRLLGVDVVWRHAERLPPGRHVCVSNHVSVGDLMVLFRHPSLPQRYTHLITSSLPAQVTRAAHLPVLMRPASPATYDQLASSSDPSPIHLFPEGGMTNGRGMLRFSRGFTRILQQQPQLQQQQADQQNPAHLQHEQQQQHEQGQQQKQQQFQACLPVVPVALRVRGSLSGVNSHTLNSSFLANLFWFGFSPSTTLEATVLPPMVPLPGEARGAFVNRVQAAIAEELGVQVYDLTIQQKRQLAGRGRT